VPRARLPSRRQSAVSRCQAREVQVRPAVLVRDAWIARPTAGPASAPDWACIFPFTYSVKGSSTLTVQGRACHHAKLGTGASHVIRVVLDHANERNFRSYGLAPAQSADSCYVTPCTFLPKYEHQTLFDAIIPPQVLVAC